jgi:hypothetical protein
MHESHYNLVITPRTHALFWRKVEKLDGGDGCWMWRGGLHDGGGDGYGYFSLAVEGEYLSSGTPKRRNVRAHRMAWRLVHGEWPPEFDAAGNKLLLMHSCDVRLCVKAVLDAATTHLNLGTNAENSADMVAKGRAPGGARHYSRVAPELLARGELVGGSKLTKEQVAIIKGELAGAPKSPVTGRPFKGVNARIAEHFHVTPETIMLIDHGTTWRHVAPAVIEKSILPTRVFKPIINAKLDAQKAHEIRQLHANGKLGVDLAKMFGVSPCCISDVIQGQTWLDDEAVKGIEWDPAVARDRGDLPRGEAVNTAILTETIVREIRARAVVGEPKARLAEEYSEKCKVSITQIYRIIANKCWQHVA